MQEADSKKKSAVALSYQPEEEAPKVIASGKGYIAEKIIRTAEEEHIPIHEDKKLANALSPLEIGEFIPPELYKVVADILVFVDDMERIKSKMKE